MSNDTKSFAITITIAFTLLFTVTHWHNRGMTDMKKQAVKVGHARYIVDNVERVSFGWLATQTAEIK